MTEIGYHRHSAREQVHCTASACCNAVGVRLQHQVTGRDVPRETRGLLTAPRMNSALKFRICREKSIAKGVAVSSEQQHTTVLPAHEQIRDTVAEQTGYQGPISAKVPDQKTAFGHIWIMDGGT